MKKNLLIIALILTTCACATTPRQPDGPLPEGADQSNVDNNSYTESGIASWYGEEFHRKPTANGEIYDMYAMTAAHKTLPLGTWVTVTDIDTQKSIRVRINDRGPFVPKRIIDLSFRAAQALGIENRGTANVEIRCPFSKSFLQEDLGYWVQLGAYTNPVYAEQIARKLKRQYLKVQILSSDSYHRVRIGPFGQEDEAYRTRDYLRNKGFQAFVIRDLTPLSAPQSAIKRVTDQKEPASTIGLP